MPEIPESYRPHCFFKNVRNHFDAFEKGRPWQHQKKQGFPQPGMSTPPASLNTGVSLYGRCANPIRGKEQDPAEKKGQGI
jgi:hypothetical protein